MPRSLTIVMYIVVVFIILLHARTMLMHMRVPAASFVLTQVELNSEATVRPLIVIDIENKCALPTLVPHPIHHPCELSLVSRQ